MLPDDTGGNAQKGSGTVTQSSCTKGWYKLNKGARLSLYWPGVDYDIENMIAACTECQDHLSSNAKELLLSKQKPTWPIQETAADFCYVPGRHYLIWVYCHTDWSIIVPMDKDTTTECLIAAFRRIFSQTVVPDILWTDRGPQFMAHHFQLFAKQWEFRHSILSTE